MNDPFTDLTQEDTTPSNITNSGDASILGAYFGLDDAFPSTLEALCPNSTGQDGMPVVFSHKLDVSTVQAGDFLITNADGQRIVPLCTTFRPATAEGELRTVLLMGPFGTNKLESVCVVGDIWDECHQRTFRGSCIRPKSVADVPELVLAEEVNATTASCPVGASARAIRATWDAGVTLVNGAPVPADYASKYSVTLADGSVIHPVTLADINDNDNNHLLCFNATTEQWAAGNAAMSVAFEAGFFTDPNEDGTNQETAVNIRLPVTCPMETSSGVPNYNIMSTSFSWLWLTGFALLHMLLR